MQVGYYWVTSGAHLLAWLVVCLVMRPEVVLQLSVRPHACMLFACKASRLTALQAGLWLCFNPPLPIPL